MLLNFPIINIISNIVGVVSALLAEMQTHFHLILFQAIFCGIYSIKTKLNQCFVSFKTLFLFQLNFQWNENIYLKKIPHINCEKWVKMVCLAPPIKQNKCEKCFIFAKLFFAKLFIFAARPYFHCNIMPIHFIVLVEINWCCV